MLRAIIALLLVGIVVADIAGNGDGDGGNGPDDQQQQGEAE